jgi:hypothetical protein
MDIEKDLTRFEGVIQIGDANASEIANVLHGQVTLDFSAAATPGAYGSASAAISGLTASHKLFLQENASAEAAMPILIKNVLTGAGSFSATCVNASAAGSKDAAANTFAYFAIR